MEFVELSEEHFPCFFDYNGEMEERYRQPVDSFEDFGKFLRRLGENKIGVNLKTGYVASTSYYWVRGGRLLGRVNYREVLTPDMLIEGGHIGYEIRPSERRTGLGKRMLGQFIREFVPTRLGRILLTCETSNVASERVILANGGRYEDTQFSSRTSSSVKRFWIDLDQVEGTRCLS